MHGFKLFDKVIKLKNSPHPCQLISNFNSALKSFPNSIIIKSLAHVTAHAHRTTHAPINFLHVILYLKK